MPWRRARSRIWNHGVPILTPSAFTSLLRATAQPSLFDNTTTGWFCSLGLNARSQLTYMLFTSTRANICSVAAIGQTRSFRITAVTTPQICNSLPSTRRIGA